MRIKERDLDGKLAYAQKEVMAAVNDSRKLSLVIRSIYLAGLLDGRCFTPKADAGLVEAFNIAMKALRANATPALGGKTQQYRAQQALKDIASLQWKDGGGGVIPPDPFLTDKE